MNEKRHTICWPAIVRIEADAELLAVRSEAQMCDADWRDENGLFLPSAGGSDKESFGESYDHTPELIDSSGSVFTLRLAGDGSVAFSGTGKRYLCDEIVGLVQRHAAVQGHCCVAKIGAGSIEQAVSLVERIDE
jgi:hypothetical protein